MRAPPESVTRKVAGVNHTSIVCGKPRFFVASETGTAARAPGARRSSSPPATKAPPVSAASRSLADRSPHETADASGCDRPRWNHADAAPA